MTTSLETKEKERKLERFEPSKFKELCNELINHNRALKALGVLIERVQGNIDKMPLVLSEIGEQEYPQAKRILSELLQLRKEMIATMNKEKNKELRTVLINGGSDVSLLLRRRGGAALVV